MSMSNTSRRALVISIVLGTLLLISLFSYFIFFSKPSTEIQKYTISPGLSDHEKVFIGDLHAYVDSKTKENIEKTLYQHLDTSIPDLYTGTIRSQSYSKIKAPSGQTIIDFLVDTKPIDQTFKVTLFSSQDVYSINIDCAPQDRQVNPSNKCENIHHHE